MRNCSWCVIMSPSGLSLVNLLFTITDKTGYFTITRCHHFGIPGSEDSVEIYFCLCFLFIFNIEAK